MAKKKTAVEMDEKSANPGDRMKHALSLEVLARTSQWGKVTYSETHAGAGIYRESKQKPAQPHIRNLRERVLWELLRPTLADNRDELPPRAFAGAAYLELLRQWWLQPNQFGVYPGSARQAGDFLTSSNREFTLRLAEFNESNFRRLQAAVKAFPAEVKCSSFQDQLDWLTEPDGLYLVVDPFRCLDSFTGREGIPAESLGVTNGDIDHQIVHDILDRCSNKTAIVMHFWWPTTSQDGKSGMTKAVTESHLATCKIFQTWASDVEGRCYRQFHDKHNHASALLGSGSGAAIVWEVGQLAWKKSWLSSFVTSVGIQTSDEVA